MDAYKMVRHVSGAKASSQQVLAGLITIAFDSFFLGLLQQSPIN